MPTLGIVNHVNRDFMIQRHDHSKNVKKETTTTKEKLFYLS